ncbi:MAG: DUF1465 family protein [Emcibacter sp.]|nr:DUF1465 family protein [Emcibacter sp.]
MTQKNTFEDVLLEPRFMEKSYKEAMLLTQDVANYFELENKSLSEESINVGPSVTYASETMRVSTCLMQIMSWFLVQKAVDNGEITPQQASEPPYRLGAFDICLAEVDTENGILPEQFVIYLNKAQNLYRQVARMDHMRYGNSEAINTVHNMLDQLKKDNNE